MILPMSTELALRDWRYGQTQAERLCAGILSIEGFTSVDPQHPLGGPDGIKDVVCRRGLTTYVAAVYFPPLEHDFKDVRNKFTHDLTGVGKNHAQGFVFFVNKHLTIGERASLRKLAADADVRATELYHLERLRGVLDAPLGCGLRLEYLRIPMTHEEQLAYWSSANVGLAGRLDRIERAQLRMLQRLEANTGEILSRTTSLVLDLRSDLSSALSPGVPAEVFTSAGEVTARLDTPLLLWLHRLVMRDSRLPSALVGTLRTIDVTIEPADPEGE